MVLQPMCVLCIINFYYRKYIWATVVHRRVILFSQFLCYISEMNKLKKKKRKFFPQFFVGQLKTKYFGTPPGSNEIFINQLGHIKIDWQCTENVHSSQNFSTPMSVAAFKWLRQLFPVVSAIMSETNFRHIWKEGILF